MFVRILCTTVLLALSAAPFAWASEGFRDTFETLDRDRWFIADGWTNGNVFNVGWSADRVRLTDEGLTLELAAKPGSGRPFTAGEIQNRQATGYGSYEAVLRAAPGGPGMVTGFFVYSGPAFGTTHEEIDFEWPGARPGQVEANYYSDGKPLRGPSLDLGFDATRGHHHYRFDWMPDHIAWFVDGALIHREDGSRLRLPEPPAKLMVHLWAARGHDTEAWLGGAYRPLPGRLSGRPGAVTAAISCLSFVPLGEDGPRCADLYQRAHPVFYREGER